MSHSSQLLILYLCKRDLFIFKGQMTGLMAGIQFKHVKTLVRHQRCILRSLFLTLSDAENSILD